MAKRGSVLEEGEKKPLTKSNLLKLVGIFRFTLPYRGTFVFGIISLALSSATLLSFPYLAGIMLDVAQGKPVKFFTSITQVALTLFGILALQSVFSFIRVYTFSMVSERSLADIRHTVYEKIIWLPQSFFDNRIVGELLSRITADVSTLQDTFSF